MAEDVLEEADVGEFVEVALEVAGLGEVGQVAGVCKAVIFRRQNRPPWKQCCQ